MHGPVLGPWFKIIQKYKFKHVQHIDIAQFRWGAWEGGAPFRPKD